MSRLRIFSEADPGRVQFESEEFEAIRAQLTARGVRFERWQAAAPLAPGAEPAAVLAAYADDIARLKREGGYLAVDVVSLHPEAPNRTEARQKFLNEHTHAEDEVRFFVGGRGLFTLHIGSEVLEMLCVKDDLIAVPAGTRHWFDMSERPSFIAIRLFTNPNGWVANFTGDDIAQRFPRLAA